MAVTTAAEIVAVTTAAATVAVILKVANKLIGTTEAVMLKVANSRAIETTEAVMLKVAEIKTAIGTTVQVEIPKGGHNKAIVSVATPKGDHNRAIALLEIHKVAVLANNLRAKAAEAMQIVCAANAKPYRSSP